jgi:hypothetical protein
MVGRLFSLAHLILGDQHKSISPIEMRNTLSGKNELTKKNLLKQLLIVTTFCNITIVYCCSFKIPIIYFKYHYLKIYYNILLSLSLGFDVSIYYRLA